MNKERKLIFFSIGLSVLFLLLLGFFNSTYFKVTYYVWKTHGKIVTLETLQDNRMELGYAEFEATPIDDRNLQFMVTYEYYTDKISDNYKQGVATLKEEQKLNKFAKDIQKLGFKQENSSGYLNLTFEGEGKKQWTNLALNELDGFNNMNEQKYVDLIKIIRKSGVKLTDITIYYPNKEDFYLTIYEDTIKNVKTKEEFIKDIAKTDSTIASYYVAKKWRKEFRKIENDRFHFKIDDVADKDELHCYEIDENMDCTESLIYVTYQKDGLNPNNPQLKEDVKAIINLVDKVIQPKMKWAILIRQEGTLKELYIKDTDIKKYKNINELFNNINSFIK